MRERKKYPIGIQSFPEIINGNFHYVDKTEYVYRLATEGKYYFLSRPRRFGKSLLISTLETFFLGKRELFKGLAIDSYEDLKWQEYPVLHLDLNGQDYTKSESSLDEVLEKNLRKWEERYGVTYNKDSLSLRFERVIETAFEKTGLQVVILIDEYDRPLLQNIENAKLQDSFRNTMKGFFGVLKNCDPYIKFAFLTGITRFGKVSVFSDLNNLRDISLLRDYNGICGVSESELIENFSDSIAQLAKQYDITAEEAALRLKRRYDGYRFTQWKAEGIYNPFSLLNTFSNLEFSDYWFHTGTPTLLIKLLRKDGIDLDTLEGAMRTQTRLMGLTSMTRDPIPIIFQCGYLTIKSAVERGNETYYRLGFPNEEVERGFLNDLLPFYINGNVREDDMEIYRFTSALEDRDVDLFMRLLQSFMVGIPYGDEGKKIHENRFQNVVFIICRLMGLSVGTELRTNNGRIDMVVKTARYIYVIEFKVDDTPRAALAQIEEKKYALPYQTDGREVIKVGATFSTAERNITAWEKA